MSCWTFSSSLIETLEKSAPLGKNWRIKLLVFSFSPRFQGEKGWGKYTEPFRCFDIYLCPENSNPLSTVNVLESSFPFLKVSNITLFISKEPRFPNFLIKRYLLLRSTKVRTALLCLFPNIVLPSQSPILFFSAAIKGLASIDTLSFILLLLQFLFLYFLPLRLRFLYSLPPAFLSA